MVSDPNVLTLPPEQVVKPRDRWAVVYGDDFHVFPLKDTRPHLKHGCPCKPRKQVEEGQPILTHSAFDRREVVEQHRG